MLQEQTIKTKFGFKIANAILALLFFASMGLTVWGIQIYRVTIISSKYLFAIIAVGSILTFIMIFFALKPSYNIFWIFLMSILIGGGTSYFLFLYLNSAYPAKEKLTKDFKIVRTGTLAGRLSSCHRPFAVVDFNGIEKELIFNCDDEKTINTWSKVRLEYSKGLFAFDIIKIKTLLN
jgi:hypothetical protein